MLKCLNTALRFLEEASVVQSSRALAYSRIVALQGLLEFGIIVTITNGVPN